MCANNCLRKPLALSGHLCPHWKFLRFLRRTGEETASCKHWDRTCPAGGVRQTQTLLNPWCVWRSSCLCEGQISCLHRDGDTLLPCSPVIPQGTDFWRGSVHRIVSNPQSTYWAHQQMLAGLHHGQAVSGPQWEPPWPQAQTPVPALSPRGMFRTMLPEPSVSFCRLTPVQSVGRWPRVRLMGLFKDTFHCFGLLDWLWWISKLSSVPRWALSIWNVSCNNQLILLPIIWATVLTVFHRPSGYLFLGSLGRCPWSWLWPRVTAPTAALCLHRHAGVQSSRHGPLERAVRPGGDPHLWRHLDLSAWWLSLRVT